jgi:hypothetical protein
MRVLHGNLDSLELYLSFGVQFETVSGGPVFICVQEISISNLDGGTCGPV